MQTLLAKHARREFLRVQDYQGITIHDVLTNPDFPWNYYILSHVIPFPVAIQHPKLPWSWYAFSRSASFADIAAHPELPWDHRVLQGRGYPESGSIAYLQN